MKWRKRPSGLSELTDHGVVHATVWPTGAWQVYGVASSSGMGHDEASAKKLVRGIVEAMAPAERVEKLHEAQHAALMQAATQLPSIAMHLAKGEVRTAARQLGALLDSLLEVDDALAALSDEPRGPEVLQRRSHGDA